MGIKTLVSLFAITLCLVGFVGTTYAGYSLGCDPQVGIVQYEVFVGDVSQGIVAAEADGSVLWSVDHLLPGQYTFELIAITASGWGSDKSDPYPATKPNTVTNVRIVP